MDCTMVELVVLAGIGGAVLISALVLSSLWKEDTTSRAIQARGRDARSEIQRASQEYRHSAKDILHKR
jgi:hypothetical protein